MKNKAKFQITYVYLYFFGVFPLRPLTLKQPLFFIFIVHSVDSTDEDLQLWLDMFSNCYPLTDSFFTHDLIFWLLLPCSANIAYFCATVSSPGFGTGSVFIATDANCRAVRVIFVCEIHKSDVKYTIQCTYKRMWQRVFS